MNGYTRLTVAGTDRRAEVVVPSSESLGSALPRLIDLVGERAATISRPLVAIAPDGEQLDIALTPQELDLVDGSLIRVVRVDAAPPPPVVIDLTDAAVEAYATRRDRADDRSRTTAGSAGIAISSAAAGWLLPETEPATAALVLTAGMLMLVGLAVGVGRREAGRLATCATAAAAGLALPIGGFVFGVLRAEGVPPVASGVSGTAATLASVSTVLVLGVGAARRRRGAVAGGILGGVLSTLIIALVVARLEIVSAAAVVGVVAAITTGPLPWIAISAAGLTTLDHHAAHGSPPSRGAAFAAIDDAYAALTWSVAATAAAIALTGAVLVLSGTLWGGALALALALVAALRTRAFPLRAQKGTLWAAVGMIAAAAPAVLVPGGLGGVGGVVAALTGVIIATVMLARPGPQLRARLRTVGDGVETLAVVSLLPLTLGALGVFTDLLVLSGDRS